MEWNGLDEWNEWNGIEWIEWISNGMEWNGMEWIMNGMNDVCI